MTVHGDDRRFKRMTHDLADRHFDGIEPGPLVQDRPRGMQVVAVERLVDVGEVVAELPEPEGQVQQQHIPDQRQRDADRRQQIVDDHYRQRQR